MISYIDMFVMKAVGLLKMKKLILILIICCGFGAGLASAITTTSKEDIEHAVFNKINLELTKHHISTQSNQRVNFKVHAIDPRLQLVKCSMPLQVELKSAKLVGKISTKVLCQGVKPWSIYVAVSINIYKKVATAKMPLARGLLITYKHIQLIEKEISKLNHGYFIAASKVIGKQLKRSIRLGDVIKPNMLVDPKIISRGEEVTIIASKGVLEIRSIGIALMDGKVGQQIKIKNKKSKQIIKATVVRKGVVMVSI